MNAITNLDFIDKIYMLYISEVEKYRAIKKLEALGILDQVELFQGVVGKDVTNKTKLTDGAYGHAMSSIKIIQDAQAKNYKKILFLEPDIYFCNNFLEEFAKYKDKITNSSVFYLGGFQSKFYSEDTWEKVRLDGDCYRTYRTLGTFAIVLDNNIFEQYLKVLGQFKSPSDVCLCNLCENYESWVAYPNLISSDVSQSNTSSAIRPKQIDMLQKYKWTRDYVYQDEYLINTEPNKWYVLDINLNSNLVPCEICVGDFVIRDMSLLRSINKEHTNTIYFLAISKQSLVKFKQIFGSFTHREIIATKVKSELCQMDRLKEHSVGSYYWDRLGAFTAPKPIQEIKPPVIKTPTKEQLKAQPRTPQKTAQQTTQPARSTKPNKSATPISINSSNTNAGKAPIKTPVKASTQNPAIKYPMTNSQQEKLIKSVHLSKQETSKQVGRTGATRPSVFRQVVATKK